MIDKIKKMNKLSIILIVLIILDGLLGLYLLYDRRIKNDSFSEDDGYKAYNIGEKVTVKLNSKDTATFYVLKDSTFRDEYVVLFAESNIGYSAFNEDVLDGNNYKGSLIESKLKELTSSWTNIRDIRLINIDEIKNTKLYEDKMGSIIINENSFLIYTKEVEDKKVNEIYWTMSKVEDTTDKVYYISTNGAVDPTDVGHKEGSEKNKDGKAYDSHGIRPVIVVSKEYVK